MEKLIDLVLTSDQVKVIEDLIDKGAVVELIDQKAGTKIIIRRDNSAKEQEEIIKISPEIYGVGINLKQLWRKIKKKD